MKNKREVIIAVVFLLIGLSITYFSGTKNYEIVSTKIEDSSLTQSSKEYAVMSQEAWSAFECSAWATKIDDSKEAERLFRFGYKQGQKFLRALKAEKVKQEDISREVPIGIVMLLQGPSEEFILGRIHSFVEEEALDEVFYTNYDRNNLNPEDLQKSIAGNKFHDSNCQLIGA